VNQVLYLTNWQWGLCGAILAKNGNDLVAGLDLAERLWQAAFLY